MTANYILFIFRRESMKQAIIGETANREKEKKGNFIVIIIQS